MPIQCVCVTMCACVCACVCGHIDFMRLDDSCMYSIKTTKTHKNEVGGNCSRIYLHTLGDGKN